MSRTQEQDRSVTVGGKGWKPILVDGSQVDARSDADPDADPDAPSRTIARSSTSALMPSDDKAQPALKATVTAISVACCSSGN